MEVRGGAAERVSGLARAEALLGQVPSNVAGPETRPVRCASPGDVFERASRIAVDRWVIAHDPFHNTMAIPKGLCDV